MKSGDVFSILNGITADGAEGAQRAGRALASAKMHQWPPIARSAF
jgi:hypothetical protein